MVKERPEEARNSLKGNFYSFLLLLLGEFWGLWRALALFYFLLFYSLFCSLFFIKISK
ncbi:putative membrane protein [Helicobacter pylori Hp A-6]|nr:putative membrane protein [Helicobacter pylori Hp A-6]